MQLILYCELSDESSRPVAASQHEHVSAVGDRGVFIARCIGVCRTNRPTKHLHDVIQN
jgi:hypothetical protein